MAPMEAFVHPIPAPGPARGLSPMIVFAILPMVTTLILALATIDEERFGQISLLACILAFVVAALAWAVSRRSPGAVSDMEQKRSAAQVPITSGTGTWEASDALAQPATGDRRAGPRPPG